MTHELYSYVVTSDAFGDAHTVPLNNSFRNIRQKLAADKVSPTGGEVHAWIEQSNIIHASNNPSILDLCVDNPSLGFRGDLQLYLKSEMASSASKGKTFDQINTKQL